MNELKNVSQGRLDGKTAVVTGGNSGIGLAAARLFQAEGAKVALIGRDRKTVEATVEALGPSAWGFTGDVTKRNDLEGFFAQVKERFGKVDLLFVNAGIAKQASIADTTEAFLDEMFDINVKGSFYTVQKALPLLSRGSSVIMTTSVAGETGNANLSAYGATKAALRSFVRSFAAELVDQGIRVNAVSPGPIATNVISRNGVGAKQVAQFQAVVAQSIPMKRIGQPEEVAKAVLFLATEDSSFTTGAEIMVDGGINQI